MVYAIPQCRTGCPVDDCRNLVGRKGARGLCSKHYQRLLLTGSPTGTNRPSYDVHNYQRRQGVQDLFGRF